MQFIAPSKEIVTANESEAVLWNKVERDCRATKVTRNDEKEIGRLKSTLRQTVGCNLLHLKKAFTLAEVLITLVIIGIIAAITVPMINANYQKQVTVSKLKKAYANLSNAIKLSELDNGPLKDWEFPTASQPTNLFFDKYFANYIKISEYKYYEVSVYSLDGILIPEKIISTWTNLSDGTSIGFFSNPTHVSGGYVWLFLDINSLNGPNKLGKDIFTFDIYNKNKFIFFGEGNTLVKSLNCKKGTGTQYNGISCGALIFDNGFKIPKDYPW